MKINPGVRCWHGSENIKNVTSQNNSRKSKYLNQNKTKRKYSIGLERETVWQFLSFRIIKNVYRESTCG
jgi:hypothetical protein